MLVIKSKTINGKIEQNQAIDIQAAKISAVSSRNAGKYEFLTDEDNLPEKELLGTAATVK